MHLERTKYAVEFFTGTLADAETALRATRAAAVSAGLTAVVDDLDVNLGIVQRHRGNCAGAAETLQALLARDPAGLAHHLRLQALLELGLTFCYLRDWPGAEAAAADLEEQLRPDDPSRLLAAPSDIRALARLGSGDYDGALAAADQAIGLYRDSPNEDNAGYLYNVRGLVWLERGRLDRAADEFGRGVALATQFHIDRLEGICATNLAWALLRARRWDDALAASLSGAARLASIGSEAADTPAILAALISVRPRRPRRSKPSSAAPRTGRSPTATSTRRRPRSCRRSPDRSGTDRASDLGARTADHRVVAVRRGVSGACRRQQLESRAPRRKGAAQFRMHVLTAPAAQHP